MLLMLGAGVFFVMMITTGNNAGSNQKTGPMLSGPNDSDDEADESEHNTTPDMESNVSDVPKDGLPSEKSFSDDWQSYDASKSRNR